MQKSVYARASGRTIEEQSSTASKTAHLSAGRDPFKPRRTDAFLAALSPQSIYCYCWKRAGLSVPALSAFSRIYVATGVLYVVCMLPWCLMNNICESQGIDLDHRDGRFNELKKVWPWYGVVGWVFVLPWALMFVLAVKAWWRARRITRLAVERAAEQSTDISRSFDIDRQVLPVSDPTSFLYDLFGMHLRQADLDIPKLIQPPTSQDVGGDEEFEDEFVLALPPLLACWYGPVRVLNIFLGLFTWLVWHTVAEMFTLLLGWPLLYGYLYSQAGNKKPSPEKVMAEFRAMAKGGAVNLGMSFGASIFIIGICFVCYKFAKRTGVAMQLNRVV